MRIQFIQHSGFLVETAESYYLFDYFKGEIPALNPDKPVVVFASHAHKDHYNPAVFDLLRERGASSVLAVLAKDIKQRVYPEGIPVVTLPANAEYTLPGGERIETLLSTDSGVAYLLTTPEGVIYHAGDLNDWSWDGEPEQDNRQMRGSYRHEIDKLSARRIDAAFVPLDPRQKEYEDAGLVYFLERTDAKRVYPMHNWEKPAVIRRFLKKYPKYQDRVHYIDKEDCTDEI